MRILGKKVEVLSIPDLIAMKRASGRDQDREDVKALEGLLREGAKRRSRCRNTSPVILRRGGRPRMRWSSSLRITGSSWTRGPGCR